MKQKPTRAKSESSLLDKIVGSDSNLSSLVNLRKKLVDDLVLNSASTSTTKSPQPKKNR
jgi:hypothetical protein